MNTYSKVQSIVVFLTAVMGVIVTFWPPNGFKLKLAIVFVFVVLGLTAIWLQHQKEAGDKASADATTAELLNWQRGDPKKPPRFGWTISTNPSSTVLTIQFTVENDSDYPAYEMNGRLWDLDTPLPSSMGLDDILRQDLVSVEIPVLSGGVTQLLAKTIAVGPTENRKRFAAQFSCRVGGFAQRITTERVNGNWLFAVQVTKFDSTSEVVFERVDSGFPLKSDGSVNW